MKKEITPDALKKAAVMLKAMAHPMRIAILMLLENKKKLTVTEIHKALSIEQSTASHHLGILKDKMVLDSERKGKHTYYFLKNDNLTHLVKCLRTCTEC